MFSNISIKSKLLVGLIVIWAISASILLLLNFPVLYNYAIECFNLPEKSGISRHIMSDNFNNLVVYLQSPFVRHFNNLIAIDVYGRKHFSDVKNLMIFNNLLCTITSLLLCKVCIYLNKKRLYWIMYTDIKYAYYLITAIFVFCVIDFNDFFIFFHNIMFRNKDWIFDVKTNPIIKVFPSEYFIFCGAFIYAMISITMMVMYILSKRNLNKK